MKLFASAVALIATVLVMSVGVVRPAAAQTAPSVAVVDIQVILRDSLAAKAIRSQMKGHLLKFQKWGKGREDKIRRETQDLLKQRTVLAQSAFAKRQKALRKKMADFRVQVRRREQKLRQAGGKAQRQLRKVLIAAVSDVARKQGVSMVFPKAGLLYSGSTKDLTQQLLARLNTKLPTVKVVLPK